MSPIAEEIYTSVIQTLSQIDRLQLATLILDGLKQNVSVIDISDNWTEQDRSDIVDFSLQCADSNFK
jgi:hypothetical protein